MGLTEKDLARLGPALQDYFAPIWPEHHLLARRRYAYTYAWADNQKKENAK